MEIWRQSANISNQRKLQNRALRLISFSEFRANCDPSYAGFKIFKFENQIMLQNLLFVYDLRAGEAVFSLGWQSPRIVS